MDGLEALSSMNNSEVKAYTELTKEIIDSSPQLDEANTKAAVLREFIEVLGWEIPENTEVEFSLTGSAQSDSVDYALKIGGQPVAFLEAKGLDTDLTGTHREDVKSYLRKGGVELGILTNGREYEFYHFRVRDPEVPVELVESTVLEKLPRKQGVIEAYCVENIRDDRSGEVIENIRQLRSDVSVLRKNKDVVAMDVVDVLTGVTSEAIASVVETEAKEMVDRLISHVESQVPDGRGDGVGDIQGEMYQAQIVNNDSTITQFESGVQNDLMVNVTEYLIGSHGLISAIEPLPYVPGAEKVIINDSTVYEGGEMAQPREVCGDFYVELNLGWNQKKREINRMTDACGVECLVKRVSDTK